MTNFLRALSFLTIIPLPFVRFDSDGRELSNSAVYFPLAGAFLGMLLAVSAAVLLQFFPPAPAALAALILSFFLTRGLHVDGLADTADGLIGTTSREKAFKAMEDSAIGVMGAVVIFFVYMLKLTLLAELGYLLLAVALFFMPLAGRWAIVYVGVWFSPARDSGLGDLFLRDLRWPILLKASLLSALIMYAFSWWFIQLLFPVIIGCFMAIFTAHLLAIYASRRLGGITGDILGASCELAEVFFLIGFYIALKPDVVAEIVARAVICFAGEL